MTIQEHIAQLQARKQAIIENKPLAIAVFDTHSAMVGRIFDEGLKPGGKIGQYNATNPLYVNPLRSPRKFPTIGKTGQRKFDNGQPHKTGYFQSYKTYRAAIGRQTSFVDLQLFGNLRSDFRAGLQRVNNDTWISVVKRPENGRKVDGIDRKYGGVFLLTKGERDNFIVVLQKELSGA